jgi:hypothetical protein
MAAKNYTKFVWQAWLEAFHFSASSIRLFFRTI